MTDLDRLRAAMREPVEFAPVDVERVMAAGTRIRRRRRLRNGMAAVAGVAAVMVIIVGSADWLRTAAVQPAGTPSLTITSPARPTSQSGKPIMGDIIRAGDLHESGELAFYLFPIDEPGLEETRFGLVAGRMSPEGRISDHYTTNETEGPDTAPGFHGASIASDNGRIPAFGYYVGPATKITATIGGKTVQAHQAEWSENRSVKVWWFDYSTKEPSNLAAFDASGTPLPLGNNGFGRG
ncbi:hypothetical protein SAMN05192558_1127 [Actinokineospora alba]|uniref:Uncharacterized protein n=1 Tax=Actinokineospora alba TaxID=504798 RepID=A0A1H0UR71_9PSEU|nr:hypothetical protein [Actinokineospora alba]TDP69121.1 hypothetical protein C8E96_4692 [Actinokineospora alba]SDI80041.1 hypothetical protein SAMN05421871_107397 [Actinokineospora alba]SDP68593.1 hypothetical protein SAMN05192558_1127 [Actinokineospora alba]